MKKRMILAILLVAATVQITSAQPNNHRHDKKAKQERTAEAGERKHDPKQFLARELGLTDAQAEAFAPIYAEYRKAIRGDKSEQHQKFNPAEADDTQTLAHINEWLDKDIRTATVRKQYIDKFLTVLTPKQVAKLYHLEKSFANGSRGPQRGEHRGEHGGHPQGAAHGHGPHNGPAPRR